MVSNVQLLCNASHSLIVSGKHHTGICHLCTAILQLAFLHMHPFVCSGRGQFSCDIQACALKIPAGSQQAVATGVSKSVQHCPCKIAFVREQALKAPGHGGCGPAPAGQAGPAQEGRCAFNQRRARSEGQR